MIMPIRHGILRIETKRFCEEGDKTLRILIRKVVRLESPKDQHDESSRRRPIGELSVGSLKTLKKKKR